jgi:uncharacterized membrane protein
VAPLGAGGAAIVVGAVRRSPASIALAGAGGYLLYRGITRHDPLYAVLRVSTAPSGHQVVSAVQRSVTIDRPAREIYDYWRRFETLPRFMQHLVSVREISPGRTRWVARAPFGRTVVWEAEITAEQPGELLAWRSLPGPQITNAGTVRFTELRRDRGTVVEMTLEYVPPAGPLGAAVAQLAGEEPHKQVADALLHPKELLEAGEIATTAGQPTGNRCRLMRALHRASAWAH